LHGSIDVVAERLAPGNVSVALYDAIGAASLKSFIWIESRVDPAKYHCGSTLMSQTPDGVPTKSIPRVDTDPDDIARLYGSRIERFHGLVTQNRIAKLTWCRSR
jgi:hypothetical protein